jgi:hypothetical protein
MPVGAGPEDGGLRLRLTTSPRMEGDKEGYDVRLDVMNVSQRDVTLRAAWRDDEETGDLKDYLEAATSIESVPAVAPWSGGVRAGQRTLPQPEQVLKAGEVLSVQWRTDRRRIKNAVTDPNVVQNPEFPFPGLYSVHATLNILTSGGTVRLRSNEQLVPVAGGRAMPKYTFGRLWHVATEINQGTVNLGSLHKIEVGDQFEIGHAKGGHWKLTVTRVDPEASTGDIEVLPSLIRMEFPRLPPALVDVTLIRSK